MTWFKAVLILFILCAGFPVAAQSPTGTPDYRQMVPVGTVMIWIGNSTPTGWLVADGSCVLKTTYAALYSVVGDQFIFGIASICPPGYFGLPDLRGRFPLGSGSGGLLDPLATLTPRSAGQMGGIENKFLTVTEMPPHTHGITTYVFGAAFVGSGATTRYVATNAGSAGSTGSTGAGYRFTLMNPYLVVHYIINAGTTTLELPPTATVVPTATPQPTSTPAPTATPQPTATPMEAAMGTPAPEVVVYSTITANGTDQNVAFAYSITAGDMLVSIMLFVTCGVMVMGMMLRARGGKA